MDLEVAAGEFVAILGPSGCGKSTLLRIVAGLDRPTDGDGDASAARRGGDIGVRVPGCAPAAVAHRAEQRGAAARAARRRSRAARREAATDALVKVGLGDALERYPAQLSGGMRMRVSLARAMVTEPTLLLLDEPFAALDEITRQRLDEQLRELWQARADDRDLRDPLDERGGVPRGARRRAEQAARADRRGSRGRRFPPARPASCARRPSSRARPGSSTKRSSEAKREPRPAPARVARAAGRACSIVGVIADRGRTCAGAHADLSRAAAVARARAR